jgi:predicted kinase
MTQALERPGTSAAVGRRGAARGSTQTWEALLRQRSARGRGRTPCLTGPSTGAPSHAGLWFPGPRPSPGWAGYPGPRLPNESPLLSSSEVWAPGGASVKLAPALACATMLPSHANSAAHRLRALAPALVLTSGLPATGKSWFARRAADGLAAELHQSDVLRREMYGSSAEKERRDRYDQGRYAPDAKQKIYDALLERARAGLQARRSVVIDGSFVQRTWRVPFEALARELGLPFCCVRLVADEGLIKRRLARRALDPGEASEANFEVYLRLRDQQESLDDLDPLQRLELDSARFDSELGSQRAAEGLESALASLAERLAAQVDAVRKR